MRTQLLRALIHGEAPIVDFDATRISKTDTSNYPDLVVELHWPNRLVLDDDLLTRAIEEPYIESKELRVAIDHTFNGAHANWFIFREGDEAHKEHGPPINKTTRIPEEKDCGKYLERRGVIEDESQGAVQGYLMTQSLLEQFFCRADARQECDPFEMNCSLRPQCDAEQELALNDQWWTVMLIEAGEEDAAGLTLSEKRYCLQYNPSIPRQIRLDGHGDAQ